MIFGFFCPAGENRPCSHDNDVKKLPKIVDQKFCKNVFISVYHISFLKNSGAVVQPFFGGRGLPDVMLNGVKK